MYSILTVLSGENLAMQRENNEANPNSALTLSESVTGINVNSNNINSNGNSNSNNNLSNCSPTFSKWILTQLLSLLTISWFSVRR